MEENQNIDIKEKIAYHLEQIIDEAETMKSSIGEKDYCLLCEIAQIKDHFNTIQSSASFYYLKSYIEHFTNKTIEIARALQNLSDKRHGCLMIIERSDSVEQYIQAGVQINADCSSRLIESIFFPGNPLHDGALLIKTDHIISAANVLPLTSQNFGGEKIGTRHRAAIGLSECTDALILIVSEETGRMSFALDGTLYPISSAETRIQ
ncbi:uncharacterized protein (TIGR00159 family) [Metabacillus malikii]|uniref:Diadenylate cyclase n=1 Tax=Metabacillus malikii TaxID=1504265 RepID=A0ABT9Z9I1_9BACI|nr:sporulation-specific diadenylate cyclase CdaS [Metabacillus malikii]MDQ0228913.1 uncharacterized protein (TIGR00159 family) [Metabacillus malikii]